MITPEKPMIVTQELNNLLVELGNENYKAINPTPETANDMHVTMGGSKNGGPGYVTIKYSDTTV